jgi:hypothetical protein
MKGLDHITVEPSQAFKFLKMGYELSRTSNFGDLDAIALGKKLGFKNKTSRAICAYLARKGFINCVTADRRFRISSKGLDEIEWSLARLGHFYD